jgi:uncharacterized membrane protein YidH (DUF202 family)
MCFPGIFPLGATSSSAIPLIAGLLLGSSKIPFVCFLHVRLDILPHMVHVIQTIDDFGGEILNGVGISAWVVAVVKYTRASEVFSRRKTFHVLSIQLFYCFILFTYARVIGPKKPIAGTIPALF